MTNTLELRAGDLRLALRPDLGGATSGLWLAGEPVLRSIEPDALDSVRRSGNYALVPYSSRIGYRHFRWLGRDYTLAPNVDEPHSLHGVGWQRPWRVEAQVEHAASLVYEHPGDEHWPFPFVARQRIMLQPLRMHLELEVTNKADMIAPIGMGWHPFFPKRQRSRLHAEVSHRWEAEPTLLPTRPVAQPGIDADVAHLSFDNCFDGWGGAARIRDEKLSLALTSSLDRLVVYTPPQQPFFAVEPVSHVNNAINMAVPETHGLRRVEPESSVSAWMLLQVSKV
ncbi:MAG TPA: aldose 1-epimerase [Burkholderiaceae bacterium]|nr:aldose 1-epimerase [Burkholderiaceae bacterium]